jgi:hypothetical protein
MQAIKCIPGSDLVCEEWLMHVTGVVVGDGAVGKVGARNSFIFLSQSYFPFRHVFLSHIQPMLSQYVSFCPFIN